MHQINDNISAEVARDFCIFQMSLFTSDFDAIKSAHMSGMCANFTILMYVRMIEYVNSCKLVHIDEMSS